MTIPETIPSADLQQFEIQQLIAGRAFLTLKNTVRDMDVHDLAVLFGRLADEELAICFRLMPRDRAAELLGDLEPEQQAELLRILRQEKVAALLNEMAPDDRTELLEELPAEVSLRLLNQLRGQELKMARALMGYPEESIGRLMTPEFVAVRPGWTVSHVLEQIRKVAPEKETLNVIYVVDDNWNLIDDIRLEDFVLAEPDQHVADLMDGFVAHLNALDDRETAVELLKKYDAVAMPVVDSRGKLVGIVTFDDVMDVQEEESTEDFQMMAGMAALESSYFATGFLRMLLKRLPWLVLLLMAQMLVTLTLTSFHALPLFAVLVVFMPLINSPAGNTGTQMSGLVLRGLAVQEIATGDWFRVLRRESLRGLAMGVLLGVVGYGAAFVFAPMAGASAEELGEGRLADIATSVGLAITLAVTLANLLGAMLPFFFKKIGLDPAVTSGPFIASLMDVSGVLVYFGIAMATLQAIGG